MNLVAGALARFAAWSRHPWSKSVLFVLAMAPFACWLLAAFFERLGANPAQALLHASGVWTLRLLCLLLALTPWRMLTRNPALARFRRMLGLFVYFYAALHMLCYGVFDMSGELAEMFKDAFKRPFILVGWIAFALLSLLASTSSKRAVLLLGGHNWKRLHQLVYGVAVLSILHFFWMRAGKNDWVDVAWYGAILSVLLGWRLWYRFK